MSLDKELKMFVNCMIEKIPELKRAEISITENGKYGVISFDCSKEDVLNELVYQYGMYTNANIIESFFIWHKYIHAIVRISEFNAYLFGYQITQLVNN